VTVRDPAGAVFADPDQPAVALLTLGVDRFGAGCVNWHPEAWRAEIEDETGVSIHPVAFSRLMAACTLYSHPDEFYASAASFCPLAEALAGERHDPYVLDLPDTDTCARAAVEAHLCHPPDRPFAPEIGAYVHRRARYDGYASFPAVMRKLGMTPDPGVTDNPLAQAGDAADEDPDAGLATALAKSASEKDDELNGVVSDHLRFVAAALRALPLKTGDAAAAADALEAMAGPDQLPA
jgi:hypothetical protein